MLFQLRFPCELKRECSSLSLFSTSKGTEAKERGKKGRGREMTAAGQEREHDRGKSLRERNCSVGGSVHSLKCVDFLI